MAKGYLVHLENKETFDTEMIYVEVDDDMWQIEAENWAADIAATESGWNKSDIAIMGSFEIPFQLSKTRKIIGTCRECKWWKHTDSSKLGKCTSPKFLVEVGISFEPGEDFGCIHWERKE